MDEWMPEGSNMACLFDPSQHFSSQTYVLRFVTQAWSWRATPQLAPCRKCLGYSLTGLRKQSPHHVGLRPDILPLFRLLENSLILSLTGCWHTVFFSIQPKTKGSGCCLSAAKANEDVMEAYQQNLCQTLDRTEVGIEPTNCVCVCAEGA